ncbi:DUF1707 SHOCT-like domain-containing protein [Geodermatophilus marinus]|uniref:DUF1707 SHOCT-like domain-containing protein n=1 Tax=Geodermatophilus sp. LHW52908 TaxID=2303986 RepID=UPI000E3E762C|nr:DUF1707 domain-containing protein [Geodermatophilus sp. LHW52908]RFU21061.1 DUF1707 domain-containing protein [Geodermatophilus sp. LHW52908]
MPEPHLRAADADRAAVAAQLGEHLSAGRLTVVEYDERLAAAYTARTYGELAELTADLPATSAAAPVAAAPAATASRSGSHTAHLHGGWSGGPSRAAAWRNWAYVAVVVLGVWLTTCLATGELLYPWPIWVIGPWGAVLLAQTLTRRGEDDEQRRQLP